MCIKVKNDHLNYKWAIRGQNHILTHTNKYCEKPKVRRVNRFHGRCVSVKVVNVKIYDTVNVSVNTNVDLFANTNVDVFVNTNVDVFVNPNVDYLSMSMSMSMLHFDINQCFLGQIQWYLGLIQWYLGQIQWYL